MRTCPTCHETKPLSDFTILKNGKPYSYCRKCNAANTQRWQLANPDKARACARNWHAKNPHKDKEYRHRRRYGIEPQEYGDLWRAQSGLCAICGLPETRVHRDGALFQLSVDHDHSTGEVRGLLCHGCNVGIGGLRDDISNLAKAIKYLTADTEKN